MSPGSSHRCGTATVTSTTGSPLSHDLSALGGRRAAPPAAPRLAAVAQRRSHRRLHGRSRLPGDGLRRARVLGSHQPAHGVSTKAADAATGGHHKGTALDRASTIAAIRGRDARSAPRGQCSGSRPGSVPLRTLMPSGTTPGSSSRRWRPSSPTSSWPRCGQPSTELGEGRRSLRPAAARLRHHGRRGAQLRRQRHRHPQLHLPGAVMRLAESSPATRSPRRTTSVRPACRPGPEVLMAPAVTCPSSR